MSIRKDPTETYESDTEAETKAKLEKILSEYYEDDGCCCAKIIYMGNKTVVMCIPGGYPYILSPDKAEAYNKMFHWW